MIRYIYCLVILGCVNFYSCKKSELLTYEGKQMLVFTNSLQKNYAPPLDSVVIDFSLVPIEVEDTVINFPIRLIGQVLDVNRPFNILIDDKLTTGIENKDFEVAKNYVFPSDTTMTSIPIKINRPSSSNSKFRLGISLPGNEYFLINRFRSDDKNSEGNRVVIYVSDELNLPPNWTISGTTIDANYYLGPFSKKKLFLISKIVIQKTGNSDWTPQEIISNVENDWNIPIFGQWLNEYLIAEAKAGTPVMDENGAPMVAGDMFK